MSVIRLIHIVINSSEVEKALQVWKKECAPLMIRQKGCMSEKLLRCRDTHESFHTLNGEPKPTSRPTSIALTTRKLYVTHVV